MHQYTVPQFLDVEDKILGSITVRQFVILLIGGFFMFLAYRFLQFTYFIISGWGIFAVSGLIAFAKINGRPFHYFMLNFIQTKKRPSVRVWLKELTYQELKMLATKQEEIVQAEVIPLKHSLQGSSLSELSLIVDTGGAYKGEDSAKDHLPDE